MDNKKIWISIILIVLVLDISCILYMYNLKSMMFDEEFHRSEFDLYDIQSNFDEDIVLLNSKLLNYLRYDKSDALVDMPLFNEKEKEHLLDVKRLVQRGVLVLNILTIALMVLFIGMYILDKKGFIDNITRIFIWGGAITFLEAITIFIMVRLNFDSFFRFFHVVFFKSGTWLFRADEALVSIYQERFFYDILVRIVTNTLIMALILIVIGFFIIKIKRYINKKNKDRGYEEKTDSWELEDEQD